jgi:hypothetical protein
MLRQWVAAGAVASLFAWGGPALAGQYIDDAAVAPEAGRPAVAPIGPSREYAGWLALRADLLRRTELPGRGTAIAERNFRDRGVIRNSWKKRWLTDRLERPHGNGREFETRDEPLDPEPITIEYEPARGADPQPPDAPEPSSLALMSVGLASLIAYNRRMKTRSSHS